MTITQSFIKHTTVVYSEGRLHQLRRQVHNPVSEP